MRQNAFAARKGVGNGKNGKGYGGEETGIERKGKRK